MIFFFFRQILNEGKDLVDKDIERKSCIERCWSQSSTGGFANLLTASFISIINGLNPGVSANVSHQQQFFSELLSPGRSHYTNYLLLA